MERTIFTPDHDLFRSSVREFVSAEIAPYHAQWASDGMVPRAIWRRAGGLGYLCMAAPEEFGGAGVSDFRYDAILGEELARQNCTGPGFGVHGTVVATYFLNYGTPDQQRRWVPGMVTGETILAVGMTEASAGSDMATLRTTAHDDGDAYVVSGHKSFVTNGSLADLVLVSCVTNPEHKQWGVSLLAIELPSEGVTISKPLKKIGWHAQDTVQVFLDDVRVPKGNVIGQPGQGFYLMRKELDQERMLIAVNAIASARAALDWTLEYSRQREAFGQPIGSFQNSRFRLAEMETELTIGQVFIDRCIAGWAERSLTPAEVAMAKWWATDLQQRVIDTCLQLHGGYGYMAEYPIAQAWLDMRWTPIGGGTNEIMKDLIGRSMGL